MLEHLARCPDCREVLALSLPELVARPAFFPKPSTAQWLSWPTLRWAAAAACVVVLGAVFTQRIERHEKVASLSVTRQGQRPDLENDLALKSPSPSSENDRLAAKLEAPSTPRLGRDSDRGTVASKMPTPAQTATAASSTAMKNAPNIISRYEPARPQVPQVPSMSEAVRVAAAAAPSAAGQGEAVQSNKQARAEEPASSSGLPRATNETVEVTAEAPLVESSEATPGKAKDAKKSLDKEVQAQTGSTMVAARTGSAEPMALNARNYTQLVTLTLPARWRLSAEGAVERSLDAGKTWQPMRVAEGVIFRTMSAVGAEVWVGGASGALYHSSDNGQTWTQAKPTEAGTPLAGDIISLLFVDVQHGKLTTADHQTWVTSDAGKTWQKL